MVAIVTHFDKYRGVAAGLKYTGNSLSSLVLPKVLSLLRAAYSMRGTMLIYGALCMNSTAFVLFLRERRPATRKHQVVCNYLKCFVRLVIIVQCY
ncbi:hypothetical protein V5799_000883 [Amblyomma americanum]|uniref:Major facilitator superfamily (MFS) profile domain-containing protein n=1 Tax=Amblyomma americanum TaxID=6943 RepID=A0AAQ4D1S6_AMBAM